MDSIVWSFGWWLYCSFYFSFCGPVVLASFRFYRFS